MIFCHGSVKLTMTIVFWVIIKSMCDKCLKWKDEEYEKVAKRILNLSDEQIIELFEKAEIYFAAPMKQVIEEIRIYKVDSVNLNILMTEAESKQELLKWIKIYEENKIQRK